MIQVCTRLTPDEWDDLQAYASQHAMGVDECALLLITRQPMPNQRKQTKTRGIPGKISSTDPTETAPQSRVSGNEIQFKKYGIANTGQSDGGQPFEASSRPQCGHSKAG